MLHEFQLAVCDDEKIFIHHICQHLETYESQSGDKLIVSRYVSGLNLLEALRDGNRQYDILFLDVDMPVMQGIDVAMEVRKFDKDIPIFLSPVMKIMPYKLFRQMQSVICLSR